MKILIIDQFGQAEIKESLFVPRVGDKIDMFFGPLPSVTQVVVWPSIERLQAIGELSQNIDAIITVKYNPFIDILD